MTKESIQHMALHPKRFLVVGDIMMDQYCYGSIQRISPEAPVPVLRYVSEKFIAGGAANVATNLVGMGQKVALLSVVGKDAMGEKLEALLEDVGIDCTMVAGEKNRPTTCKTRFVAGNQQLLRMDDEVTVPMQEATASRLLEQYEASIEEFDLVLLSDYMKGVLTFDFTRRLIEIAAEHGKHVIVDVKDLRCEKYAGAYLLKPNRKELHDLTGCPVDTLEEVKEAMQVLKKKAGVSCVLATLSGDGMAYLDEENHITYQESDSRKVYDVVGAGDTAFAYVAAAHVFGCSVKELLKLANTASSIKITKFGTSVVTIEEVIDELFHEYNKIQTIDTIAKVLSGQKNKKVVFTNGCFDILHIGHVKYLKEAKNRGDILVLGLNSDASVKRLKGPTRPINNEKDRMDLLAEMDFIDYLVVFDEDTPIKLIEAVCPDILVKGGDYEPDQIVGADFVRAHGGTVEVIPFVEGKSTTNIIEAMHRAEENA